MSAQGGAENDVNLLNLLFVSFRLNIIPQLHPTVYSIVLYISITTQNPRKMVKITRDY